VHTLTGWTNQPFKVERKFAQEIPVPSPPVTGVLLEGAAYAAALKETQRQLQLLISQENQGPPIRQAPRVLPHPPNRPQGQARPIPLIDDGTNPFPPIHQPTGKTRSTSDPHLLRMTEYDMSTSVLEVAHKWDLIGRGSFRVHSPVYQAHGYEDSYSLQRSPMNPRFHNFISPTKDLVRPPPSIVLRYRSEHIAQQLCLIEREYLNQVQWYELVTAGWKKKSPEATVDEHSAASTAVDEAVAPSNHTTGEGSFEKPSTTTSSTTSPRRATSPWPLSRTQTGRTHTQRFLSQTHTKESPSVTQLVDRFNLVRQETKQLLLAIVLTDQVFFLGANRTGGFVLFSSCWSHRHATG
jgi:hypothetical protein